MTFDDVDAEVCRKCGERYFHAATLNNLNRQIEELEPAHASRR